MFLFFFSEVEIFMCSATGFPSFWIELCSFSSFNCQFLPYSSQVSWNFQFHGNIIRKRSLESKDEGWPSISGLAVSVVRESSGVKISWSTQWIDGD